MKHMKVLIVCIVICLALLAASAIGLVTYFNTREIINDTPFFYDDEAYPRQLVHLEVMQVCA